jgi:hypothetical protein
LNHATSALSRGALSEVSVVFTTAASPRPGRHGDLGLPGNGRDRTASFEASHALPPELRAFSRISGRIRTSDTEVGEVTVLFTTGNLGPPGNGRCQKRPSAASSPFGKPDPASHPLSRSRLHGTSSDRRDSNPQFPWYEVSDTFTTGEAIGPHIAGTKLKSVAALVKNPAPPSEPCFGSPRHRWTARSARAPFPPTGPALRAAARRAPGSGSPARRCRREIPMPSRRRGAKQKPLRSGGSGGVRLRRSQRSGSPGSAPASYARARDEPVAALPAGIADQKAFHL